MYCIVLYNIFKTWSFRVRMYNTCINIFKLFGVVVHKFWDLCWICYKGVNLWDLSKYRMQGSRFRSNGSATFGDIYFLEIDLLRYNSHTAQFIHLKFGIKWFSVYSQNYVTITKVNFGTSSSPHPTNLFPICIHSPFVPTPIRLGNHPSTSVSV